MMVQTKKLFEQEKHLTEATCTIAELQKKQADEDEQISNLNRKVTDYDQKFADIATRIDRICTVDHTEKLTVEPRASQLQHKIEFGHLDVRKLSAGSKCTPRMSRKRQRPSDKGDEGECDVVDRTKDAKKVSVCNTYTLRQRKTGRRQSNDNDVDSERAANSRCVSQKRAKMSS